MTADTGRGCSSSTAEPPTSLLDQLGGDTSAFSGAGLWQDDAEAPPPSPPPPAPATPPPPPAATTAATVPPRPQQPRALPAAALRPATPRQQQQRGACPTTPQQPSRTRRPEGGDPVAPLRLQLSVLDAAGVAAAAEACGVPAALQPLLRRYTALATTSLRLARSAARACSDATHRAALHRHPTAAPPLPLAAPIVATQRAIASCASLLLAAASSSAVIPPPPPPLDTATDHHHHGNNLVPLRDAVHSLEDSVAMASATVLWRVTPSAEGCTGEAAAPPAGTEAAAAAHIASICSALSSCEQRLLSTGGATASCVSGCDTAAWTPGGAPEAIVASASAECTAAVAAARQSLAAALRGLDEDAADSGGTPRWQHSLARACAAAAGVRDVLAAATLQVSVAESALRRGVAQADAAAAGGGGGGGGANPLDALPAPLRQSVGLPNRRPGGGDGAAAAAAPPQQAQALLSAGGEGGVPEEGEREGDDTPQSGVGDVSGGPTEVLVAQGAVPAAAPVGLACEAVGGDPLRAPDVPAGMRKRDTVEREVNAACGEEARKGRGKGQARLGGGAGGVQAELQSELKRALSRRGGAPAQVPRRTTR